MIVFNVYILISAKQIDLSVYKLFAYCRKSTLFTAPYQKVWHEQLRIGWNGLACEAFLMYVLIYNKNNGLSHLYVLLLG